MDKLSHEEFAEMETAAEAERRHDELVSVLRQIAAASDLSGVEKTLATSVTALATTNGKGAAQNLDLTAISKAITESVKTLKPDSGRVVFEVIRDGDGLIKQVIKITEEKK